MSESNGQVMVLSNMLFNILCPLIVLFAIVPSVVVGQNVIHSIDLPAAGNEVNNGMYLNRNAGYLRMINGTGFDGKFSPRISGLADSDGSPGLVLVGTPSDQNIFSRGILLRGGEGALLPSGNVLQVANFTTSLLVVNHQGDLGLGNDQPKAKVHLQDGDIFLEDVSSGIIMKSPDGNCWRYRPDNSGVLVGVAITCPN